MGLNCKKRGLIYLVFLLFVVFLISPLLISASVRGKSYRSTWEEIKLNTPVTMEIDHPEIMVTKVAIKTKVTVERAELVVTQLNERPVRGKNLQANIYGYFDIEQEKLPDQDLADVKIEFRIPHTWFSENKVSQKDISLYRYDGAESWVELSTTKLAPKGEYIYYEARTPALNYFAVSQKSRLEAVDLMDRIDEFYRGKSPYTAFDIIDLIRSFYEAQ